MEHRKTSDRRSFLNAAGKLAATVTPLGRLLDRRDVERLAAERASNRGPEAA